MSVSYDEMILSLKDMFGEWDEGTLGAILEANNFHIESTIEQCLSMASDLPPMNNSNSGSNPAPYSENAHGSSSGAPMVAGASSSPPPTVFSSASASATAAVPSSSVSANGKRGSSCQLPSDFLRPPGWKNGGAKGTSNGGAGSDGNILPDEELAKMLQDELFQQQVAHHLGYNTHGMGRSRLGGPSQMHFSSAGAMPPAGATATRSRGTRRPPAGLTPAQQEQWYAMEAYEEQNSGGAAGHVDDMGDSQYQSSSQSQNTGSGDLGILKSLSNMTSAMKSKMSNMARSWNQRQTSRRGSSAGTGLGDGDEQEINFQPGDSATRSGERRSLLTEEEGVEMHNPMLMGAQLSSSSPSSSSSSSSSSVGGFSRSQQNSRAADGAGEYGL